jgi:hypothetical protein
VHSLHCAANVTISCSQPQIDGRIVQLHHTQCIQLPLSACAISRSTAQFKAALHHPALDDCRQCKFLRSACRKKALRRVPTCRHPISQRRMRTSAKSAPLCFSFASYGALAQHLQHTHVCRNELSAPVIQRYLITGTGWVRRPPPSSVSMSTITAGRTCRKMSRVTCARWCVRTDEREKVFATDAI